MKLGRPLRVLGAMVLAAVVPLTLVSAPASAAPAAPAAYLAMVRAYPLFWASGSLPVADLRVPYVSGMTNHLTVADASSALARPDLQVTTMSAEQVSGLSCTGYPERLCADGRPFRPEANAAHTSGAEGAHREQAARFEGPDGEAPGSISAVTECARDCGSQLIRTTADAAAPGGSLGTYVTVGSSTAHHNVWIDERGRLMALARSELHNVTIGPNAEVRMGSIVTTALASGTGAEGSKDGRSEVRVGDFTIFDKPVELTRAGLRLASGAPSEQEAYDGAQALLDQLEEHGIILQLPDFSAHLDRHPGHVTVKTDGLRVRFERSVEGPQGVAASDLVQVINLGSATAVVAAFDDRREIDVSMDGDEPVVSPTQPQARPPATAAPAGSPTSEPPATSSRPSNRPSSPGGGRSDVSTSPAPVAPDPEDVSDPALPVDPDPAAGNDHQDPLGSSSDQEVVLGPQDVANALRGADAVTRAFGAFLGLGLLMPVARILIRRLG